MSAPFPPADLNLRSPEVLLLKTGELCHRFYSLAFDPFHFDRSHSGRMNAPDGAFGVLYVARNPEGAFAETFLRNPGRTLLPLDLILAKGCVAYEAARELRLVRLTGTGLAKVGATAEITHGSMPYDTSQAWSALLHAHPDQFDGIAYTARHDDEQLCFALFDRCKDALMEISREADLDQDWFHQLLVRYGAGIAPA